MSKKAIRKSLRKLAARQEALCAEVAALRAQLERTRPPAPGGADPGAASSEEVVAFLDRFRAGEALGEAATGAWIAVSRSACLRGGLRTVQRREGSHARLLEERLKELGASSTYDLPEEVARAALAEAGSTEKSDGQKVRDFVARFGDAEAALAPIEALAARLDHDPETQWLLRTIARDERATIEFFQEACSLFEGTGSA